ncbi:RagB/SusD family nutrient uptake outer membrane protein [Olivibacter sp. SDN3]|uniref:RagB/SusD family nutrient uptake outer membrane protein n=1 Tax=Olivibacter sp. SDN3 TaxID=2764720 RepID=UPI001651995C|nr:RagB/SusD family nutrient uptake outer membrane protein [Olivibacter sp. SDN3]QNL48808.1 RagB/SusD family nutrient uptake outer membrane protein [Olivibacter sp. SDN3]
MKRKVHIIVVFIAIFLVESCSHDKWLGEHPPHLITTETLYTSLDGFEAGLNGLYSLVRGEREGRDGTTENLRADIAMLGTDNIVPNQRGGIGFIALTWDTRNVSTDSNLSSIFLWLYQIINGANTIINQAETRTDVDWNGAGGTAEENQTRVIAEAKALRAWAYRHLTFCWGDVPLNLEESSGSNIKTDWMRASVAQIRNQMKEDWLYAEQYLDVEPPVRGKISKGAVQHYLSEFYLTTGQPDSALILADQCINTPNYELITQRYGVRASQPGVAFMDMFYGGNANRQEGNTEALWVWQWEYNVIGGGGDGGSIMRRYHNATNQHVQIMVDGVVPLRHTVERGGIGIGREQPTKWAIDLYEPQDDRGSNYAIRKYYILQNAAGNAPAPADNLPPGYQYGDTIKLSWENDLTGIGNNFVNAYPFIRKYDTYTPSVNELRGSYDDQPYLRLAETYLLKAEAQLKLGNTSGAAETINTIRRRAHASEISASDVTIDFILDERSRELIGEEHRRYTLLRVGKWLERVKAYNFRGGQTAAARDTLYPIPQVVIDANLTEKMPQNPGFN